jgi:2-hydroxymuconate-semialdehyde hydrolase
MTRDDRVIPVSSSQQLAEQIPGARLEVLPECGHWVQIERTDEFCAAVLAFLGQP